jgi:hypothetical protein
MLPELPKTVASQCGFRKTISENCSLSFRELARAAMIHYTTGMRAALTALSFESFFTGWSLSGKR